MGAVDRDAGTLGTPMVHCQTNASFLVSQRKCFINLFFPFPSVSKHVHFIFDLVSVGDITTKYHLFSISCPIGKN